jgi:hypothetical protein
MTTMADLALRVVLLVGALYSYLGYAWGGKSEAAPYEIYAASPWIALAIGALVPNSMLSRASGKLLFFPIALLGTVRSIHQIGIDLTLENGPDYAAAIFRTMIIALLCGVAIKTYFLSKKPEGLKPNEQHT